MLHHISFNDLKKSLKKDFSGLEVRRLALLGDSATQLIALALKGYGYELGVNFDIYESDYNQIEQQVFNIGSKLYQLKPEFVVIFHSTQKLVKKFYQASVAQRAEFADKHIDYISTIYNAISSKLTSKLIYFNFLEVNDSIFGNYTNKVEASLLFQLRKINYELMKLSRRCKNLYINDISSLQNLYGNNFISDSRAYVNADMAFSIDFIPIVTKNIVDIAASLLGKFKKCLILDLDNVLWGGVIGDDGLEGIQVGDLGVGRAFTEIQLWAKNLKERGILLVVCSKNDEYTAKEPFLKHPEMILRLDDIALFVANWNNKADNIKYIQSVLNIGYDSMVFLDDNPCEREIVRANIAQITVPEMPVDPAEYLNHIRTLNLFETASFTEEDAARTRQYQQETMRSGAQKEFISHDDFLRSLNMLSIVKPFDKFTIPRAAQLTQRSNQFNLRTVRYSDEEIRRIASSPDYFTFSFSLEDKFGNHGLVSVVILKKEAGALFIDTWIMSCRVLQRTVENFALNQIVDFVAEKGFAKLVGEYLPTAKNGLVRDFYNGLGFTGVNNLWLLDLSAYSKRASFVKRAENGL